MANIVYKSDQVDILASRLSIPKVTVKGILDSYCGMLERNLESGKTVRFLRVCYLVNCNDSEYPIETLAYTCSELSRSLGVSSGLVYRVLVELEDLILRDIVKFYGYVIRGIVRVRVDEYGNSYKLRLLKSTKLGSDYRVYAIGSFKRKVEASV